MWYLSKQVNDVIQYWYKKQSLKRQLEVGVITVIHTFGRDLKWNPHVHALITEGAIDKHKEWKSVSYIPYEYLRKSWQKLLCDLIQKWFPNDLKVKYLINELYQRYQKGFYVNAETRMKDARGAAKYIGRYLARPAIAEYRIVDYNGKEVHFWYEDHQTGKRVDLKISVFRFIYLLLQHIPPKHFRMVRDSIIEFQCIDCGSIDEVPVFVVGEFSFGLKEGEEVEMFCPECNGTIRRKK